MIIELEFDYPVSRKSLLIEITVANCKKKLDLRESVKNLSFDFVLPIRNQTLDLCFHCDDSGIVYHPLTITSIVLDQFYNSDRLLYRGKPNFDETFLSLAAEKNMYLDTSVNDSNRLDFTGTLMYQFEWPFYKNIFK